MSEETKQDRIDNWIVKSVLLPCLSSLATLVISMTVFWMLEARNYVTESKVKDLITDDNKITALKLQTQEETNKTLIFAVNDLNKSIQKLEVQIAVLGNKLEKEKNGTN